MNTWPRVARLFLPYRAQLAASLVLVLAGVGLSSVSPLLLRQVLSVALPRHQLRMLTVYCALMIATGICASLAGVAQGLLANRTGQRIIRNIREDLYDHLQMMGLDFFAGDANTEIQARLVSDIGGLSDVLTFTAQGTLTSIASLVTTCVVMLILSWPLAIASVVIALLLNMLNQRFAQQRNRLGVRRQSAVARMLKLVGEDLSLPGVILGRTMVQEHRQRSRFIQVSDEVSDLTYRQRLAGRTAMALIGMTMASLPPLVYLLSGTIFPQITLGTAVVLATMQMRLSPPLQQLLGLSGTLQSSKAMFDRVFAHLDLEPGPGAARHPRVTTASALELRGVDYRYPGSGALVLSDVTLRFAPRSFNVITGPSGSGKSTLALLMAGLITPAAGTVTAGRDNAVLVQQDAMLFNASLRENLLFARPDATASQLADAVLAAGLGAAVGRLPDGLDTMIGERGFQLSGGERQRVALARALLIDRPLLIVDEATSALDGTTAAEIYARLRTCVSRQAVILIAHRLPKLRPDDRVIVLTRGRVVEDGPHGELIRAQTIYRELADCQAVS